MCPAPLCALRLYVPCAFHFHDDPLIHNEIRAKSFLEHHTLVLKANNLLSLDPKATPRRMRETCTSGLTLATGVTPVPDLPRANPTHHHTQYMAKEHNHSVADVAL